MNTKCGFIIFQLVSFWHLKYVNPLSFLWLTSLQVTSRVERQQIISTGPVGSFAPSQPVQIFKQYATAFYFFGIFLLTTLEIVCAAILGECGLASTPRPIVVILLSGRPIALPTNFRQGQSENSIKYENAFLTTTS